ncbi:MAG: DUF4389 domain-containing protein [Dehalococcoidia bacterium]
MTDESQLYSVPPPEPPAPSYPVTLEADPPGELSRLSTFFRIILAIPLFIFVAVLSGGVESSAADQTQDGFYFSLGTLGSLVVAHWVVILVRRRPVGWLFDTIVHIQRFSTRALAYILLLTDKYPPFEGEWFLRYEVERPEVLSRWKLLFWKVITAIPHILILIALWFLVAVVVVIAWFAILFTGRFPAGLYNLVVGWLRWEARVSAYVMSLTDVYPPFSMN